MLPFRLASVGQRYRIVYRVERRDVTVLIVAVGRRRSWDKRHIYELAKNFCAKDSTVVDGRGVLSPIGDADLLPALASVGGDTVVRPE